MIKTKIYKIKENENFENILNICVKALKQGKLIAFPTETVYGVGADLFNADAVKKIYEAKIRPENKALLCHLVYSQIEQAAYLTEEADKLIKKFTPGPLSVILRKKENIPSSVSAGTDTIGLRFPSNRFAVSLIEVFGPLAATSANISGNSSPKKAADVIKDMYGRADIIIDGGDTEFGLESTIISLVGKPALLREGAIGIDELRKVINI